MIEKIIKFLVIHCLDKNDDFLSFIFSRDDVTDYQIIKITYDENGLKRFGTKEFEKGDTE